MPRTNTNWAVNDQVSASHLQAANPDIDDLYANGSDRLKVRAASSGTALKIDISAGAYIVGSARGIYAGGTDISVTNGATNYVEIDTSGTIQINTTGWTSSPVPYTRLGIVVASGGAITSITVWRADAVGGDLSGINANYGDGSDGALNVTSGTTSIDCTGTLNGILVKQYTSFNVSVGATLNLTNVPNSGVLVVVYIQGNQTMAGTLDGSAGGSLGGAGVSHSFTSNTNSNTAGNAATEIADALRLGQTRKGGGGAGSNTVDGGSGVYAAASGGGSGANSVTDGASASSASTTGTVTTATGGAGGASLTSALNKLVANIAPFTLAPGAGGGSGGTSYRNNGYSSGTFAAASQNGGRGGASFLFICGGSTFSNTGTINTSGTAAAGDSTASAGTNTGANQGHANAAGGSAGGSAGNYLAIVRKNATITDSATYTQTGGAGKLGATTQSGTGGGGGSNAAKSDGANGIAGVHAIIPMN